MLLFSNLIEKAEGFRVNVLTDGAFGHICQEVDPAFWSRCGADLALLFATAYLRLFVPQTPQNSPDCRKGSGWPVISMMQSVCGME